MAVCVCQTWATGRPLGISHCVQENNPRLCLSSSSGAHGTVTGYTCVSVCGALRAAMQASPNGQGWATVCPGNYSCGYLWQCTTSPRVAASAWLCIQGNRQHRQCVPVAATARSGGKLCTETIWCRFALVSLHGQALCVTMFVRICEHHTLETVLLRLW